MSPEPGRTGQHEPRAAQEDTLQHRSVGVSRPARPGPGSCPGKGLSWAGRAHRGRLSAWTDASMQSGRVGTWMEKHQKRKARPSFLGWGQGGTRGAGGACDLPQCHFFRLPVPRLQTTPRACLATAGPPREQRSKPPARCPMGPKTGAKTPRAQILALRPSPYRGAESSQPRTVPSLRP